MKTRGYKDCILAGYDSSMPLPQHPAFNKGIDFIRRMTKDNKKPFCCFISTFEPHDPYIPPREFLKHYDIKNIPLSPSLYDDLKGKPEIIKRMHSLWKDMTENDWKYLRAAHWAMISFLDSEVGRIISVLKETGKYDNTVIVLTSDHGDLLGAHGLPTKGVGTSYEEVYNIPLIIRVPELNNGVENSSDVISLVDIAPTLLDLCGASKIPDAHGRSLIPILKRKYNPAEWRDAYAEFYGQRFVYSQRILWHDSWKYVFNPGGIDELYNLADDPYEMKNLAHDPAQRECLESMCRRMWRKIREIGDMSLFNTHYTILRTAPVGPLEADIE